jgi:hypothetical protein
MHVLHPQRNNTIPVLIVWPENPQNCAESNLLQSEVAIGFYKSKVKQSHSKTITSSIENPKSKNISSLTGFCAMPPCHN